MVRRKRKSDTLIFAHKQLDVVAGIVSDLGATGEQVLILNAKDGAIMHVSYKIGNVNVKNST